MNKEGKTLTLYLFWLSLLALALSVIAFFYIKLFKKFEPEGKTWTTILKDEFVLSLKVTIAMALGSLAISFFLTGWFQIDILMNEFILIFFLELYTAMIYGNLVKSKYGNIKIKNLLIYWSGIFIIFLTPRLFEVNISTILLDLENLVKSTIDGVLYIINNPIDYANFLLLYSQGNQFIIAQEYPKWSLIFIPLYMASSFLLYLKDGLFKKIKRLNSEETK